MLVGTACCASGSLRASVPSTAAAGTPAATSTSRPMAVALRLEVSRPGRGVITGVSPGLLSRPDE